VAGCSSKLDVVQVSGTDFAHRQALHLTDMYRELYKPFHKRVNTGFTRTPRGRSSAFLRRVVSIIDDFIEAGVDILNPVQTSAKGMDRGLLKNKFGDRLVFWGGGVDTQFTLPFGTPDEVMSRRGAHQDSQSRRRICLHPGAQRAAGVPAANLLAMFQASRT